MSVNLWTEDAHASWYLQKADGIPHRREGELELLGLLDALRSQESPLVVDLGCGDGRLLGFVLEWLPSARGIAVDFNTTMIGGARQRFAGQPVEVVEHDLCHPLAGVIAGPVDAVVSSFAIHHLDDERKRSLYDEVFHLLRPGGIFANLEHVASPTAELHRRFLELLGIAVEDDDPSNQLLDVGTQIGWLDEIGFVDSDCYWKWRELALLAGAKSG